MCCYRSRLVFNCCFFKTLNISQGSVVATHLRCGWIFSDSIITRFLLILTVKHFENMLIFDEVKAYQNNWAIFGPPDMSYAMHVCSFPLSVLGVSRLEVA